MIGTPVSDIVEDLIVMNGPSLNRFLSRLKAGGTLFTNSSIVTDEIKRDDIKIIKIPVTEMALEIGSSKVFNIIMLGVYIGFTDIIPEKVVLDTIIKKLSKKASLIPMNKEAFEKGLAIGKAERKL